MKLDIPFFKARKDTDCGPLALKMVSAYFGEDHSFKELAKLEYALSNGLVWTLGIAVAAKKLGFPVKMYSLSEEDDFSDIEYYKKHANNEAMLILKRIKEEASALSVQLVKQSLSLHELIDLIRKDSVPIVLLNWNIIKGKPEGYHGHIVPITGYDEKNVYVHNPGLLNPAAHFPIAREAFMRSWESRGTDKDVVIIYHK
jgi:ABC-type bacteriocin/lantibiotic exporter with double-glycine peptidase domain